MAGLYQFRIDEKEKAQAFSVIESYGLTPAQVLRSFLLEIGQTKKIPLSLNYHADYQPNASTAKLMQDIRDGSEPMYHVPSIEALMKELNASTPSGMAENEVVREND